MIIGVPKAATTSLASYLGQHPDVFMAEPKEPHFLAFHRRKPAFRGIQPEREWLNVNAVTDFEEYVGFFRGAGAARAVGEASSNYLYLPEALEGIQTYVPAAKLIIVLRNPVDRAFSSFLHLLRDGREVTADFGTALGLETQRIAENWSPLYRYTDVGRYAGQLERYFAAFGSGRINVVLYDDLESEPDGVLRDLFDFLGVRGEFKPDISRRHNQAAVPRSPALQRLLASQRGVQARARMLLPRALRQRLRGAVRRANLIRPSAMDPVLRRSLTVAFRNDVQRVQDLIDRDLASWLADC